MDKVELELFFWSRFRTRNFAVEPELLSRSHEFDFEQHKVSVTLPSTDDLSEKATQGEQVSVGCYREIDDQKIPLEFNVHTVDISIFLPNKLNFPAEILSRPPKAYDLFSENQRKSLDVQTERGGQVAERAYDLWIRILRWKCNNSRIGRPEIHGAETGWATYLIDQTTNKPVWASPAVFMVKGYKRVTVVEWDEVGKALEQGLKPPVFYDLMFDGEEHLNIGDLHRGVVDLAVACEDFMRNAVMQHLPKGLNNELRRYIDEAHIRQVLNYFFPEVLNEDGRKLLKKINSDLQKLFTARNDILHCGRMEDLTLNTCQKFLDVTRKLISIDEITV